MNTFFLAGLALLVDCLIGDPTWLPHPVVAIGKWIQLLEKKLNRPSSDSQVKQRLCGVILTASTVLFIPGLAWVALFLLGKISPWLYIFFSILLTATTIAWKGLNQAGRAVLTALCQDGLEAGRKQVGMIVSRDTDSLSEPEVIRATVETLAENIVDAIVSPVFYACLGGAPLALLYRATNTLDSMVGYKNERYRYFGWASARLDDVLNYVPARLTAILLWLAILLKRSNARQAWMTLRRDARKHPSPNSGIPEAMVAGALDVQLGGRNSYGGVISERARMGSPNRTLEPRDITRTTQFVSLTAWILCLILGVTGSAWLYYIG